VHGPYEPENGHRYNPNKLVLDPYAKAVVGKLRFGPELFGYKLESFDDRTFDDRDSAPLMLKCRVVDPAFTWGRVRTPNVPWDRTIVYELHARGFTKLHPDVPEPLRGTFRGLGHPSVIDYLRRLHRKERPTQLRMECHLNDRPVIEKRRRHRHNPLLVWLIIRFHLVSLFGRFFARRRVLMPLLPF
jgi:isoamylase